VKYEYKAINVVENKFNETVNKLASQDWEVIASNCFTSKIGAVEQAFYYALLRREKK